MAVRAAASMVSPCRTATVRAALLSWPEVMIRCGSGTMAPSQRHTLTWSLAASSAQILPGKTKYGSRLVR